MIENKKRNDVLDVTKGFCVFLVILGHVIQYFSANKYDFFENKLFQIIYSFHMPLFMILSGYLFYYTINNRDTKYILKNRIFSILQTIIIWNTITYILKLLYSLIIEKIEMNMYSIISNYINSLFGLWFLWAVVICSFGVLIIYKYNFRFKLLSLLLYSFIIILFPNRWLILFLYPYFLLGFYFNKNQKIINIVKSIQIASFILFPLLLFFYGKEDFIYTTKINPFTSNMGFTNQIAIDLYRWFIGGAGIVVVITIIKYIVDIFSCKKIIKVLSELGKISLEVYVIQYLFLENIGAKYLKQIDLNLSNNELIYNIVISPIFSILILLIIFVVIKLLCKKKNLYFLVFGR